MSSERYDVLFQVSSYPAWLLNTSTCRFVDVSTLAAEMFGYAREELRDKPLSDVLDPSEHERCAYVCAHKPYLPDDTGWWETRMRDATAFRMHVRVHAEPGDLLFCFVTDVTDHPTVRIPAARSAASGF